MTRYAPPALAAAVFAAATVASTPVSAQDHSTLLPSIATHTAAMDLQTPPVLPGARFESAQPRRPNALLPLYLSFASLQGLDVHSTMGALGRGAAEGNPLMASLTASPASLLAVKAASTAGVLYTTEQLWKKNPTAAVIFMVAANSAMAWVVQNNYRVGR